MKTNFHNGMFSDFNNVLTEKQFMDFLENTIFCKFNGNLDTSYIPYMEYDNKYSLNIEDYLNIEYSFASNHMQEYIQYAKNNNVFDILNLLKNGYKMIIQDNNYHDSYFVLTYDKCNNQILIEYHDPSWDNDIHDDENFDNQ